MAKKPPTSKSPKAAGTPKEKGKAMGGAGKGKPFGGKAKGGAAS